MKDRHVVAHAADIPHGSRQVVTVGGHEIGIFNLDGEYYALLNRCPPPRWASLSWSRAPVD